MCVCVSGSIQTSSYMTHFKKPVSQFHIMKCTLSVITQQEMPRHAVLFLFVLMQLVTVERKMKLKSEYDPERKCTGDPVQARSPPKKIHFMSVNLKCCTCNRCHQQNKRVKQRAGIQFRKQEKKKCSHPSHSVGLKYLLFQHRLCCSQTG